MSSPGLIPCGPPGIPSRLLSPPLSLPAEQLADQNVRGPKGSGSKKLSVEHIYQKKTQLEHILLRPDTYIGSVEQVTQVRGGLGRGGVEGRSGREAVHICFTDGPEEGVHLGAHLVLPSFQQMWVFDEGVGLNCRDVTFVPGLYKIFDEILGKVTRLLRQ